jgi:hypothetical protein
MSTRLGVKRTAEVVASSQRTGADGQLYYDIQTRVRSYASRNQLAVTQDVSGWVGGGREGCWRDACLRVVAGCLAVACRGSGVCWGWLAPCATPLPRPLAAHYRPPAACRSLLTAHPPIAHCPPASAPAGD